MSTIVTRSGKGSPLTHVEVDANFTNLNSDKTENATAAITGGSINGTTVGATTPAAGTFTTLIGGGGSANYFQTQGAATTKAVEAKALGSDTNIAFVIDSKGTGAIDLAAGSSGVNISNGGTVTAITRTASGTAYTSAPSVVITAPTTAGGVQATATCTLGFTNPVITNGGTGYTVSDVLSVVGGTSTTTAQLTVTSVSGGVITGVSILNAGVYSVAPSNPSSVTGGTGSSATFTLDWVVRTTFTITNAGSGYVEQPTVSFSGGGGSGAAAYATVGSGTVIRSLGASLDFYTPSGTALTLADVGVPTVNRIQITGNASSGNPAIRAIGSTNVNLLFSSNGTGYNSFYTSGFGAEQLRVANTASAVNYVQVTGAATGGQPTISAQGSDTNAGMLYTAKGFGSHTFRGYNGSNTYLTVGTSQANPVNSLQLAASSSGNAVSLSALGSDTNIPLVLQPKGTGALQAQQTDSTATGGNARGANAVDWQTSRGSANQVASATASNINGGANNNNASAYSTIGGGFGNTLGASNGTLICGGSSNTIGAYPSYYSAIVGGYNNTANGWANFIGAGGLNSGTSGSAVTTQSGTMNGTTAVTLSGSNANIKVGQLIQGTSINTNTYVAAVSGTSLTLSQAASGSSTSTLSFYTPHGVVVGGGNNQATGSYSFIGGGGDAGTAANRNVASGDWSFVGGGRGNTASGIGSIVVGGGYDGFNNSPSTASGTAAAAIGSALNASGAYSFASGYNSVTSGTGSSSLGGLFGTSRSIVGLTVLPASNTPLGTFVQGNSQSALLVLARQTTDATATVLTSNTSAASTTNQVILPNNSAYTFRGEIVSGVTGGGNSKSWTIEGLIKRGANAAATTLVGSTVTSMYADVGAATWTIALSADTTNGGLAVTFTGQAGTTIRTVCQVRTTEMTY